MILYRMRCVFSNAWTMAIGHHHCDTAIIFVFITCLSLVSPISLALASQCYQCLRFNWFTKCFTHNSICWYAHSIVFIGLLCERRWMCVCVCIYANSIDFDFFVIISSFACTSHSLHLYRQLLLFSMPCMALYAFSSDLLPFCIYHLLSIFLCCISYSRSFASNKQLVWYLQAHCKRVYMNGTALSRWFWSIELNKCNRMTFDWIPHTRVRTTE